MPHIHLNCIAVSPRFSPRQCKRAGCKSRRIVDENMTRSEESVLMYDQDHSCDQTNPLPSKMQVGKNQAGIAEGVAPADIKEGIHR